MTSSTTDNQFAALVSARFRELEEKFALATRRIATLEREYRALQRSLVPKKRKAQAPAPVQTPLNYAQPQPAAAL